MNIILLYIILPLIFLLSFVLMFWFEDTPIANNEKIWWLRLPIINLFTFIIICIYMFIEETYLTFHPEHRTKWVKTSIKQIYFD